jgi:[ribosomal protein S18]-alanine N-acetyltransferase
MKSDPSLSPESMKPSDLDEVLAIEERSFAAPWTRETFMNEMANRTARSFVFRLDGEIAGYLCFWAVLDEAHVQTIAVRSDLRGRGYGKRIMGHLEAACLREGLRRIILEVARRNTVARNLYRACGFSAIGFRKRYYAETEDDAIVMQRWLGENSEPVES